MKQKILRILKNMWFSKKTFVNAKHSFSWSAPYALSNRVKKGGKISFTRNWHCRHLTFVLDQIDSSPSFLFRMRNLKLQEARLRSRETRWILNWIKRRLLAIFNPNFRLVLIYSCLNKIKICKKPHKTTSNRFY
jgi:hypothetical protein